jgi:hypothetical protein
VSPSHEVQIRTRMFARVIGPLFAFSCITALVRASDMKALVTDSVRTHCGPGSQGLSF